MPRIAAEIDAVTSPSWISLIRAPAARISSIRSWWRGRSSTSVVMSFALRPNASAIAAMFSATGRVRSIRPFARGPTAIRRMYMSGSRSSEPGGADREHRHRAVAAARDDAAALERVEREVERLAAGADLGADLELLAVVRGPITTCPRSASSASPASIAPSAASSAASWSSRPSQRAAASAAHSVARAKSAQGQVGSVSHVASSRRLRDAARRCSSTSSITGRDRVDAATRSRSPARRTGAARSST